MIFIVVKEI